MNTNDNATPNDPAANERARQTAAANLLPVMLAMLPLNVAVAACEWCAFYILTLAKGRNEASEMHERSETELRADVRAVCDVILAGVLGHTALDAIGRPDDGTWDDAYLASAFRAVQGVRERVTGLRYGEQDTDGAVTDVTALDVRERASTARRRGVAVAIVATLPEHVRDEVLGHVAAWEGVLRGLAQASSSTDNPAVVKACDVAAWEAVQVFFTNAARTYAPAINALSALWHGAEPVTALRALASDLDARRELVDGCDDAAGDLAHIRALLSTVAA